MGLTDKIGINKRSRDKPERFYIDNELLEDYAQIIGPHGIAVYSVLAKHAHSRTQSCFPSYETIMVQSGVGNRGTVSKRIKLLKKLNMILVEKKGRSNLYTLLSHEEWGKSEDYFKKEKGIDIDTNARGDQGEGEPVSDVHDAEYQKSNDASSVSDTLSHTNKSNKNKSTTTGVVKNLQDIRNDLEQDGTFGPRKN